MSGGTGKTGTVAVSEIRDIYVTGVILDDKGEPHFKGVNTANLSPCDLTFDMIDKYAINKPDLKQITLQGNGKLLNGNKLILIGKVKGSYLFSNWLGKIVLLDDTDVIAFKKMGWILENVRIGKGTKERAGFIGYKSSLGMQNWEMIYNGGRIENYVNTHNKAVGIISNEKAHVIVAYYYIKILEAVRNKYELAASVGVDPSKFKDKLNIVNNNLAIAKVWYKFQKSMPENNYFAGVSEVMVHEDLPSLLEKPYEMQLSIGSCGRSHFGALARADGRYAVFTIFIKEKFMQVGYTTNLYYNKMHVTADDNNIYFNCKLNSCDYREPTLDYTLAISADRKARVFVKEGDMPRSLSDCNGFRGGISSLVSGYVDIEWGTAGTNQLECHKLEKMNDSLCVDRGLAAIRNIKRFMVENEKDLEKHNYMGVDAENFLFALKHIEVDESKLTKKNPKLTMTDIIQLNRYDFAKYYSTNMNNIYCLDVYSKGCMLKRVYVGDVEIAMLKNGFWDRLVERYENKIAAMNYAQYIGGGDVILDKSLYSENALQGITLGNGGYPNDDKVQLMDGLKAGVAQCDITGICYGVIGIGQTLGNYISQPMAKIGDINHSYRTGLLKVVAFKDMKSALRFKGLLEKRLEQHPEEAEVLYNLVKQFSANYYVVNNRLINDLENLRREDYLLAELFYRALAGQPSREYIEEFFGEDLNIISA